VRGALLEVEGLSKRFHGIVASDDIQFAVQEGELHAVIGPNGAGKTTLIGQLSGEVRPDAGWIRFAGRDVTALSAHRRSLLGLARSFQITSLFLDFTTLDNVALAVQAHAGHSFGFWRNARREARLRDPALAALRRVGLEARAHVLASKLSHGEHRQLELAMALATRPRMLLLDEPTAGLDIKARAGILGVVRGLIADEGIGVLWATHLVDEIRGDDHVVVLHKGRVLADGSSRSVVSAAGARSIGEAFTSLTGGGHEGGEW